MSRSKPHLIVVGSSNTDLVIQCDRLPKPGETLLGGLVPGPTRQQHERSFGEPREEFPDDLRAKESGGALRICSSMAEAFQGAQVVYPKSWGPYDLMLERVDANRARDNKRMTDIEQRALTQRSS